MSESYYDEFIRSIERNLMKKSYHILHVSKESKHYCPKTLVRELQGKGYMVDVFLALCYHKANCDTSSIKCQAYVDYTENGLNGTYCSHRCTESCQRGQFMKITDPNKQPEKIDLVLHDNHF